MFLPIMLDFENNGLKFMLLKYLRFFDYCMQNDWAIITHEEFEKYEINFPNRNEYKEKMQKIYGYSLYDVEERKKVKQYFVPRQFYEEMKKEKQSKLASAVYLLNKRNEQLEDLIEGFIVDLYHQGENIEGILYFAACPLSIKIVAKRHNIPMIAYETGPIREENYRCNTSYFCREGLYNVGEIEERYQSFKTQIDGIPLFKRDELLALFLSEKNLGFLSLIDKTPKYEVGIAGGCAIVVPYFALNQYTDHEMIDDILDDYPYQKINVRLHPGDMYKATYRFPQYDASDSPFPFLLNSKRIVAIGSNMLFEAMLWKRIACSKVDVMPANLFCNKSYDAGKEKAETELFVNFFMFSFLTPSELAYDEEYLRWRISEPTETEIYKCHLMYYLEKFELTEEWLKLESEARLRMLLVYRNYIPMKESELNERQKFVMSNESFGETRLYYKTERKLVDGVEVERVVGKKYEELELELEELQREYDITKNWLDNMLHSTCWKITAPLRWIVMHLFRRKKEG